MNNKSKLLEEFKLLLNILEKNKLYYSLIAGSLLGAVKFNKIIPWDDDIDIAIDINTYKFLKKNFPNNIVESNDKGYPLLFPKWVPNKNDLKKDSICIDLFVRVKTNKKNIKKFQSFPNKFRFAVHSLSNCFYPFDVPLKILNFVIYPFRFIFKKHMSFNDAYNMLFDPNGDEEILIVNPADALYKCDVSALPMKNKKTDFEGLRVNIPADYDNYFKVKYGNIDVEIDKERKVEIHTNTYNVITGKWNGKKIIYNEKKFKKSLNR